MSGSPTRGMGTGPGEIKSLEESYGRMGVGAGGARGRGGVGSR